MHWAESTIYFSSALLISPIVPLWVFRLLSLGLLVSFAVAKLFGINIAFEDCCFKESLIFIEGFTAKLISIMVQCFWTWGFVNLQQLKEVIQNPDSNVGFPIGGPLGIRQVGEWGGGINVFMSGWMGQWMDGWMGEWMNTWNLSMIYEWCLQGSVNHYIHHAKFNWNYGSRSVMKTKHLKSFRNEKLIYS